MADSSSSPQQNFVLAVPDIISISQGQSLLAKLVSWPIKISLRLGQLVGSGQPDCRDALGERNHIRVEPDRDLHVLTQTVHWRRVTLTVEHNHSFGFNILPELG